MRYKSSRANCAQQSAQAAHSKCIKAGPRCRAVCGTVCALLSMHAELRWSQLMWLLVFESLGALYWQTLKT